MLETSIVHGTHDRYAYHVPLMTVVDEEALESAEPQTDTP